MILEIGRRMEGHLLRFSAIQIHSSRHFQLAVEFLGLCRSGFWSQIINQIQDFLEQASRHRYLGQLERDITPVAGDLGADLHQLRSQRNV